MPRHADFDKATNIRLSKSSVSETANERREGGKLSSFVVVAFLRLSSIVIARWEIHYGVRVLYIKKSST